MAALGFQPGVIADFFIARLPRVPLFFTIYLTKNRLWAFGVKSREYLWRDPGEIRIKNRRVVNTRLYFRY